MSIKIEFQDADSFGDVNIAQISKDFSVISGPSQQTSMQWINGSVTNSRIMSWSLSPKKPGRLTIPALTISLGKKKFKTKRAEGKFLKPIKEDIISSSTSVFFTYIL